MRLLPRFGRSTNTLSSLGEGSQGGEMNEIVAAEAVDEAPEKESHLIKTVGWISAALGAVALGLLVGRELRIRYKFNRRTPYDMYSHSGDELGDVDWGVGI